MTRAQALAGLICGLLLGIIMLSVAGTGGLLGVTALVAACALLLFIEDARKRWRAVWKRWRR